jgi:rubrerythrin
MEEKIQVRHGCPGYEAHNEERDGFIQNRPPILQTGLRKGSPLISSPFPLVTKDKNIAWRLNMQQVKEILQTCGIIEEKVAEIYRFFATHFHEDPPLAELFQKTAQEEDNHMLQFQLALKTGNLHLSRMKIDVTVAQNALAMVTRHFDRLRSSPPTAVQALELAVMLEEKLIQFHMDTVAVFQDQFAQNLFQAMMDSDQEHVRSLTEFVADKNMRSASKGKDRDLFKQERLMR